MTSFQFFVFAVLLVYCFSSVMIGWYVRQLWIEQKNQRDRESEIIGRLGRMESWGQADAKYTADLNKRLVLLETDNAGLTTRKPQRDENNDPFTGSRSWAAQAIAAERGEGVRFDG